MPQAQCQAFVCLWVRFNSHFLTEIHGGTERFINLPKVTQKTELASSVPDPPYFKVSTCSVQHNVLVGLNAHVNLFGKSDRTAKSLNVLLECVTLKPFNFFLNCDTTLRKSKLQQCTCDSTALREPLVFFHIPFYLYLFFVLC